MSEMIERVATALAEQGGDNWEACLKAPGLRRAGMYRSMARAAIEAMREPTDEQRNAFYELSHRTEAMVDAHWERAIDAALGKPE